MLALINKSWTIWGSLLLLLCLCPSVIAKSSTGPSKLGVQHYMKGEFKEAIASLQKALSQTSQKEERSRIYKYLGLSQFTLGQKSAAEESLLNCLKYDNSCSIKKEETLDESVLALFATTKEKFLKTQTSKVESKPATRIIVESNASNAEILIDGIMAGSIASPITAPPGTIELELHAKGYKSRKLKVNVVKNRENKYSIDLEKLPSGPSKEELAAKAAKEKARKQAELAAREKSKGTNTGKKLDEERTGKAKGEPEEDLFGFAEEEKKDKALDKIPPKFDESFVSDGKSPGISEKLIDILEDDRGPKAAKKDKAETKAPAVTTPAIPAPPPLIAPLSLLHFMPLGLGQIKNGDYILASLVAGSQAYGAYMYLGASQAEQNARNNYIAALEQARTDASITPEDLLNLQSRSNTYIAKQQQTQLTYGLVVLSAYGFGLLQGILMRPELPPSNKTTELSPPAEGLRWSLSFPPTKQVWMAFDYHF